MVLFQPNLRDLDGDVFTEGALKNAYKNFKPPIPIYLANDREHKIAEADSIFIGDDGELGIYVQGIEAIKKFELRTKYTVEESEMEGDVRIVSKMKLISVGMFGVTND